jgi:Na+-translocating ferredoxin:NAD+ oxidoreductase RnfG subunit
MKRYIFIFLAVFAFSAANSQDFQKIIQKQTLKLWQVELKFEEIDLTVLSSGFKSSSDRLFSIYLVSNDSLIGYSIASSAPGRYDDFDYFIIYDPSLVVLNVKVWKYRSTHGGAVAGKRWLRQFIGYSDGALLYGKDIQAISGATISGKSIVNDVQRLQKVINAARVKGVL